MAILIKSELDLAWAESMKRAFPDREVRIWPDVGNRDDIDYVIIWKPQPGFLASLPNLKVIYSVAAGIDHLTSDPLLPEEVPVVRMLEPSLKAGMVSYVTWACLHLYKNLFQIQALQKQKIWGSRSIIRLADDEKTVGIMGFGELGQACAWQLKTLGFRTIGWRSSDQKVEGFETFNGDDGLDSMLRQSDYVVCLLPLTEKTVGILNRENLGKIKKNGGLISVGRGPHLVEGDLIYLLQSQHLSGAIIDVFENEPLPKSNPLWEEGNVIVTPHVASITSPSSGSEVIARSIRAFEAGQGLDNVFDREKGY